jgi:hypothetical protein
MALRQGPEGPAQPLVDSTTGGAGRPPTDGRGRGSGDAPAACTSPVVSAERLAGRAQQSPPLDGTSSGGDLRRTRPTPPPARPDTSFRGGRPTPVDPRPPAAQPTPPGRHPGSPAQRRSRTQRRRPTGPPPTPGASAGPAARARRCGADARTGSTCRPQRPSPPPAPKESPPLDGTSSGGDLRRPRPPPRPHRRRLTVALAAGHVQPAAALPRPRLPGPVRHAARTAPTGPAGPAHPPGWTGRRAGTQAGQS